MNNFVRRHLAGFDRLASMLLCFGLGHLFLRNLGTTAGLTAASVIGCLGAFSRAYLFELTRPANK